MLIFNENWCELYMFYIYCLYNNKWYEAQFMKDWSCIYTNIYIVFIIIIKTKMSLLSKTNVSHNILSCLFSLVEIFECTQILCTFHSNKISYYWILLGPQQWMKSNNSIYWFFSFLCTSSVWISTTWNFFYQKVNNFQNFSENFTSFDR